MILNTNYPLLNTISMFKEFFLFELKYRLRQPMVYIFMFILALLVFGDVASDAVSIGTGNSGNANVNAPIVFYRYAGIFSFIGLLFVTAFMNTAALRDFSNKYDQILFATPINKFSYLGGRFFGSVVIATLPFLGIYIGTLVGVLTPWVDAEDVGAWKILPMLQSFFVIVLPNVLFTGAILFGLAIAFRNSIVSFVGALVLIVAYSVSGTLLRDLDNQTIASLADPFRNPNGWLHDQILDKCRAEQ